MNTDVAIVGSGAGGGPLALALSEAGLKVLVLEKGRRHSAADYVQDELEPLVHPDLFLPSIDEDPHVIVPANAPGGDGERSTLGWIASCVGGGTAHMGASLYRFHPDDFRLRTRLGAFEAVCDWPYGYDDLEPYYSRAEWEVGVSGLAGANPGEGARSRPYPMPPLRSHPLAMALDGACRQLGLHSFPTPRAINSRPYQGRPECAACDFCAGHGCPTGARGSMGDTLLARAEGTGRCRILAGAMVREVTVDARGRADGCIYIADTGAEHRVRAGIVCVCGSAVESARLLLLSRSAQFPDGLANGSGLVGRYLQFHTVSGGRGRFHLDRHPSSDLTDPFPFLGRSVMDFYFLPAGVSDYAKGGLLRFDLLRPSPIFRAHEVAREDPRGIVWGEVLKRRLRQRFQHCREVEFEVFQDFLPSERTFVELDPVVKDRWGLPAARIQLGAIDHHVAAGAWLMDKGLEILAAMGADEVLPARNPGAISHAMVHGTCRAGRDAAESVLTPFCQTHEIANLFVVDGSFMPTAGGAPSTLTILANSFRVADHILERVRTGDLG